MVVGAFLAAVATGRVGAILLAAQQREGGVVLLVGEVVDLFGVQQADLEPVEYVGVQQVKFRRGGIKCDVVVIDAAGLDVVEDGDLILDEHLARG